MQKLFHISLEMFINSPVMIFMISFFIHCFGSIKPPIRIKARIFNKNQSSKSIELLQKMPMLSQDFKVPYPCTNPGAETIGCCLIRDFMFTSLEYDREIIDTPDGGILALDWLRDTSDINDPMTPINFFVHGYVGSSQADYIKLLSPVAVKNNFRIVSMNYRGRGGVKLTSAQIFNPSDVTDLRLIIQHIQRKYPSAPISAVAFSLGGSICIKYLNRFNNDPIIKSLLCVSSPLSAKPIMESLEANPINQWLSKYLAKFYVESIIQNLDIIREIPVFKSNPDQLEFALKSSSVMECLERFDIKVYGHKSLKEFYDSCEENDGFGKINVPVLFLHAEDDPIAPLDSELPFISYNSP